MQSSRSVGSIDTFFRPRDYSDRLLALALIYQVINLYRLDRRDTLLDEAEALISRSSELAPNQHGVLKARALLLRARGKFAEAILDRPQPRRADGL
jgi:hypothetical protein